MPTDAMSPDLKTTLRRLKLSRMLDTLPERLVLARQQKMPHQDLLQLVLSDEVSRRREAIERWLRQGVRLSKIRRLLARTGVAIPYPTLHRFAVLELQFGRTALTIPVADSEAGAELQVDTGWVGWLTLPLLGRKRRRFRAWIFTAVCSRYRFVYPTFEETTARAIEACEAAWEFFGGLFKVLIPDNTKAIISDPDPLAPRITPAFLEYAQAPNFHIDAARVRHPRDKARVERAVPSVRDDCFAGEVLTTIDEARTRATHWCREEYGLRRHSRTQRRPREHCGRPRDRCDGLSRRAQCLCPARGRTTPRR